MSKSLLHPPPLWVGTKKCTKYFTDSPYYCNNYWNQTQKWVQLTEVTEVLEQLITTPIPHLGRWTKAKSKSNEEMVVPHGGWRGKKWYENKKTWLDSWNCSGTKTVLLQFKVFTKKAFWDCLSRSCFIFINKLFHMIVMQTLHKRGLTKGSHP